MVSGPKGILSADTYPAAGQMCRKNAGRAPRSCAGARPVSFWSEGVDAFDILCRQQVEHQRLRPAVERLDRDPQPPEISDREGAAVLDLARGQALDRPGPDGRVRHLPGEEIVHRSLQGLGILPAEERHLDREVVGPPALPADDLLPRPGRALREEGADLGIDRAQAGGRAEEEVVAREGEEGAA